MVDMSEVHFGQEDAWYIARDALHVGSQTIFESMHMPEQIDRQ